MQLIEPNPGVVFLTKNNYALGAVVAVHVAEEERGAAVALGELRQQRLVGGRRQHPLAAGHHAGGLHAELGPRRLVGLGHGHHELGFFFVGQVEAVELLEELHAVVHLRRRHPVGADNFGLRGHLGLGKHANVRHVRHLHRDGEKEEGQEAFVERAHVGGGRQEQDDEEPHVGEDAPGAGDRKHPHVRNRPNAAQARAAIGSRVGRDGRDAGRGNHQEVEGGRAHNGRWAEVSCVELRTTQQKMNEKQDEKEEAVQQRLKEHQKD